MKRCAVIGSGISGIASALHARSKGYRVTVFERNARPGGKISDWCKDGFRFDLGPSVFTLPELIDELFLLFDKNPRDYFSYTRLDPSFRYFFEDGSHITAHADLRKYGQEIEEKTKDSAEQLNRYLVDVARIYDITNEVFIEQSLHIPSNFLKRKVASGVWRFRHIHAFHSMDKGNKRFFKDPRLVQIFNYYATYVGSNPLIAPATMNVIQHLEINRGTYMCDTGMYGIVDALYRLACDVGVEFVFETTVDRIHVDRGLATGIEVGLEHFPFDCVISNMDIHHTYRQLLPETKPPYLVLNQPRSNSVVVLNWAMNKSFPELPVHSIFFSQDEPAEYNAISNQKTVSNDPSVYVYISSKQVQGDAPKGCENWFLLITVPHDEGQDWEGISERINVHCKTKISRMLGEDVTEHILFERQLNPKDIEELYFAYKGAVFGNSSNGMFAAFLRHPNFRRKIRNLYFAGGTVHPGAGIPMCMNSAKIVGNLL
jgi:phytoene desaturase